MDFILNEALSKVKFETVSMDFIFALPCQTFDDLKSDIDTAFLNGANHIAIYPFIDFTFTKSKMRQEAFPKKLNFEKSISSILRVPRAEP